MRVIFVLSFIAVILSNFSIAQGTEKISADFDHAPLTSLVDLIEKTTPYKFYYVQSWIDTVTVTVHLQNSPVSDILDRALHNSGIGFFIENKMVILTPGLPIARHIESDQAKESAASRLFNRNFSDELLDDGSDNPGDKIKEIGVRSGKPKDAYTITGFVKDKKTGEPLPGAVVRRKDSDHAVLTDVFGSYSIRVAPGRGIIQAEFAGMKGTYQNIDVLGDGKHDFLMVEKVSQLKEVVIESDHDANISGVQMGVVKIDVRNMKNVPKILGENDVLRMATTLPGVKTIGEGASGLNVRGGHSAQNLVLLNEATIYNTSHFLGFFSIVNPDMLRSFELYKAGMPVQHGGRLASIFELLMRDGNKNKFSGQGGLGPVTSHLTLEHPIVKGKTSVMAGARTTYSNWVLRMVQESRLKNTRASFSDYFVRLTHTPNDKNALYLTLYGSNDKFNLSTDTLFSYTNKLASLQWRHVFGPNLDLIVSATKSIYDYNMDYNLDPRYAFQMGFGIDESNVKAEVNHTVGKNKLLYGIQTKLYDLEPGFFRPTSDSSRIERREVAQDKGIESAVFASHEIEINPQLSLSYGLRYSYYAALGPRKVYQYEPGLAKTDDSILDSVQYNANETAKTYHGPEYRFSLRYKLSPVSSVKASYNRTRQYIQMLSNTVSVSPTDTWKLSDTHIAPQEGDQVSAGFYRDINKDMYEFSVELYYKWIHNILDFKTGATLLVNERVEQQVLQGEGKAYGAEIFLRKKSGKVTGWLSYAYSRTFVRLKSEVASEDVNDGKFFPANYDKPHDVSIVSNYRITRRYSFGVNFAYSTGRPITYPIAAYRFGNAFRVQYSDRNAFRIPDYMRLDVGFNIEGNHRIKKLAHSFWTISIYNILGRKNPYSIYFRIVDEDVKAYQLSIFGAPIPTITYHFKF
jgi:hypothetical protein